MSDTGAPSCQDGTALNGVVRLSVSPDGLNVYGVSSLENAVAVFSRAPRRVRSHSFPTSPVACP